MPRAALRLAQLLALGAPWAAATPTPAVAEPSLVGRFMASTTERRLIEEVEHGWGAGFADTAWANQAATVWTFSLRRSAGTLTAAEAAARLTYAARQSRLGELLFRHVLGWRQAGPQEMPEGILPLGEGRLRFLLERPDPQFPARLSAPETSLCIDPRGGEDPGCGPFQVQTHLLPWRQEIRDPAPPPGQPASWERLGLSRAAESPTPLLALLGHPARRDLGPAARICFFLPPLPAYCQREPAVPRAGTRFLVHLALRVSPELRSESSAIAARLSAGPLLPGGERSGWLPARRLLPGRARDAESAGASPESRAQEASGEPPARRRVNLRYPEGWPVMHCVAERVRALLWQAGWDVALSPEPAPDSPHVPPMEEAGFDLRLAVTAKRPEAWDLLRMLIAWAAPTTLCAWEAASRTGIEAGEATVDVLAEEWGLAEDLEARMLAGGEVIPLLRGPIDWWLEAPAPPQTLLHGLSPVWGEPPPPLVVLKTSGRTGRGKRERGDDQESWEREDP